jgi:hypothetical protein
MMEYDSWRSGFWVNMVYDQNEEEAEEAEEELRTSATWNQIPLGSQTELRKATMRACNPVVTLQS